MIKYILPVLFFFAFCAGGCSVKQKQFVTTLTIEDAVVTNGQIDTAVMVLQKRLTEEKLQYTAVNANYERREISIQSEILDKDWIRSNLLKRGALVFYECYSIYDLASSLKEADKLVALKINNGKTDSVINPLFTVFNIVAPYDDKYGQQVPPYIGFVASEKISVFKKYIELSKDVFPADGVLLFQEQPPAKKSDQRYYAVYFVKENDSKFFATSHIQAASADLDAKRAAVHMKFDAYGDYMFERMTTKNVNKAIAIVIDGNVLSAPKVMSPIKGGDMIIDGGFEKQQARNIAIMLQSGFLPLQLSFKNIEEVKKAE
jgi:hypothetical protein